MKKLLRVMLPALLAAVLLSGCLPSGSGPETPPLPGRPGPAYIQWMEEQACLRRATGLTAVVSGASLGWQRSSRESLLPTDARTWFFASPALTAWSGYDSFAAALQGERTAERLAGLGIHGVMLSGLADTGDEWAGRSPAAGLGEDAVSLSFGRLAGTEKDFAAWTAELSRNGLLPGGMLLPANTGAGPDFSLSLRSVRDYPGLYAMAEILPEFWPLLPSLKEDESAPLSEKDTAALAARGLLPAALEQDGFSFSFPARGWAATGPVTGVDGVKRRWVYRWYGRFDRPVLHWDDPSGAARRVMQAGVIQQVGLRHEVLLGVSVGAWLGLDGARAGSGVEEGRAPSLEPGLSALRDLTRNTHRYGAAVLVRDCLPPKLLADLQSGGADFFFDSVLSPSLEQSLLTGNAGAVRDSLRRAKAAGTDQKKLWRMAPEGLPRPQNSALLPLLPKAWAEYLTSTHGSQDGPRLNAAMLAAAACNVPPGNRPDAETAISVRNAHELCLAVRAFLPGLFMISGSDLDGSLPEGNDWPGTPPLWQLSRAASSRQGLPSGFPLYRSVPGCDMDAPLRTMLTVREKSGISSGTLIAVPFCEDSGVLIAASALPDGNTLVFFGNFSSRNAVFSPAFSLWTRASERNDPVSGKSVPASRLTLPPHGWRVVILH